nr:uncharacterized protein LOC107281111 isoform X9 [Oryza sativa Japonica Group]
MAAAPSSLDLPSVGSNDDDAVNNGISPRYSFDSIYLSYDGVIWRKTPKDCGLCCETPEDRVFARGHCKKCGAEARRRPQRGGGGGASPGFTADSDDARRHPAKLRAAGVAVAAMVVASSALPPPPWTAATSGGDRVGDIDDGEKGEDRYPFAAAATSCCASAMEQSAVLMNRP